MKLLEIDLNKPISRGKKTYHTKEKLLKNKQWIFWLQAIMRTINNANDSNLGTDWKCEWSTEWNDMWISIPYNQINPDIKADKDDRFSEHINEHEAIKFMIKHSAKTDLETAKEFIAWFKKIAFGI